ncbi:type IV pilin protein [Paucibacter sediminis]|uniref:Type IV pilin protein n=1 Tax=Paucibacter sediminis TaxID=3019553 RepID=A0AA95SJD2_9BURK|nr:type IV pilin protein [Paucibacter sp. S2-9]WIT09833.1 type IV pilin protein [Paucibacter sp. S2-9]
MIRTSARKPIGRYRETVSGFTLIEMMITVGLIGVLGALALPSYRDYVRRGQVPESMTALSDYRIKMEQFYLDNRSYGTGACASGAVSPPWNNFRPGGAKYFEFSCELTDSGQGYVLTAKGVSGQAVGHIYTLTQDNARATTLFKGDSMNKACWLMRGDEC